jgi:hypothetical protein
MPARLGMAELVTLKVRGMGAPWLNGLEMNGFGNESAWNVSALNYRNGGLSNSVISKYF